MNFIGGMIFGAVITFFAIAVCAAGKEDDK